MKKLPFNKIFVITLCALAIPTYAFVQYLEDTNVFEGIGIGNTMLTAFVVCLFPALLISIWWWNYQDKDSYDEE